MALCDTFKKEPTVCVDLAITIKCTTIEPTFIQPSLLMIISDKRNNYKNLLISRYNMFAKIAFAMSVWLTYPIQFYVAHEIIWGYAKSKIQTKQRHNVADYVTRALLVTFTCKSYI